MAAGVFALRSLLTGLFLGLGITVLPQICSAREAAAPPLKPPGPATIAITVDDIPDHGDLMPGVTRREISLGVIKALKQNGVAHAYGFTNGTFMQDDPREIGILKLWLDAGYPLGNHTYHHPDLTKISARAFIADIARQDRLLGTLANYSPLIAKRFRFRYPYLDEGNTLKKRNEVRAYLFRNGYRIAQVTTDYYDWAWTDAYTRCTLQNDRKSVAWLKDHIVESADRHLRESEDVSERLVGRNIPYILLVHVGIFDALTLGAVLQHWRAEGVSFISLDQALADPAYSINPNVVYDDGRNFLEQIAMSRNLDVSPLTDNTFPIDRLNQFCQAAPSSK
ncbi:MAG: polysaccharide deacetylase family protein [Candidatus Binataceae bacterium]